MHSLTHTSRTLFASVGSAAVVLGVFLATTTWAEPPQGPPDEPPPRDAADEPTPPPPPSPPPRPPREGDFRGGFEPRQRGQFRQEGGPPQRPSPDRFVERAMRYDDDKDGKLDRDELRTFAEDLMQRFQPGPGEPPPPHEEAGRQDFPEEGKRPERPQRPGEGRRPQRPDNEVVPDEPGRARAERPEPPPPLPRRAPDLE